MGSANAFISGGSRISGGDLLFGKHLHENKDNMTTTVDTPLYRQHMWNNSNLTHFPPEGL